MQQQDIGHYISCSDNEYYKVLSVLHHLLDKAKTEGRYAVWGESLEKLIAELEEKQGANLSAWAMDFVITILLDFVPDELKK